MVKASFENSFAFEISANQYFLKSNYILLFVLFFQFLINQKLEAQNKFIVQYQIDGADSAKVLKEFSIPKYYSNAVNFKTECEKWINHVRSVGYLAANIDSINNYPTGIKLHIYLGPKFNWSSLKWSYQNADWIRQTGIELKDFKGKNIQLKRWYNLAEQVLRYAENNGFPFAELKLDSVKINADSINAVIVLNKHLKVTIDSIHLKYSNLVNKNFLYHYLNIKPGMLYNESVIQKINQLMNGLNFLKQQQPFTITFIGEHAAINFFLQPQNSNKFNFLIGLQPSNTNPSPTNPTVTTKFLLSGEGDLHLENIMQFANALDVSFRLYPQQTQNLVLKYTHPYLFNSAYGVDGKFEIYKHDSTYTDVDFNFGVQHLFSANNYLKLFYSTHSSNVDWIDTNLVKATHQLPPNLDYKYQTIGIELNKEQLDFRYNPSKGFIFKVALAAGYKQFSANNQITQLHDDAIPDFNFSSLYDSILKPILHSHIDFLFANYQPIYKRSVLKLQLAGAGSPDKKIYTNELTRIGGNRLLRGFDEQSILASFYTVATAEFRYLLDKTSYAYAFYDWGYTEIKSVSLRQIDKPYGFGVGVAFGTKAGIFQLSYALGSRLDNPIIIKNGKIHFGLAMSF